MSFSYVDLSRKESTMLTQEGFHLVQVVNYVGQVRFYLVQDSFHLVQEQTITNCHLEQHT